MSALYVDSSALCKLVAQEAESVAMHEIWTTRGNDLASSDLARTEVLRQASRCQPPRLQRAREVLDGLVLIPLLTKLTETAGTLSPPGLRSLDALHLATALELGDDLEAIVTYDTRQAESARHLGLSVVSPGRPGHPRAPDPASLQRS